jgi:hypothetical protein
MERQRARAYLSRLPLHTILLLPARIQRQTLRVLIQWSPVTGHRAARRKLRRRGAAEPATNDDALNGHETGAPRRPPPLAPPLSCRATTLHPPTTPARRIKRPAVVRWALSSCTTTGTRQGASVARFDAGRGPLNTSHLNRLSACYET